ncbi:hypothetical protein Syun_013581 [Stephania yunnanensis]|uniref:Thioredoxin domain-containing protein n=1 Tax=Stephania yunnanensis TaxID=152371 RepID=A0AAP0JIU2_9MAGN
MASSSSSAVRVSGSVIVVVVVVVLLGSFRPIRADGVCAVVPAVDLIAGARDTCLGFDGGVSDGEDCGGLVGVVEGNEESLQKAVDLVYKNSQKYVAVLFYASWCPFSKAIRPTLSVLSSLYPSVCHLAVEESSVRPRTLGRYRVHGFPTLVLFNSTLRWRYHGSRTIDSFVEFYSDVTGMFPAPLKLADFEVHAKPPNSVKLGGRDRESCPFPWAWFPNNVLDQEGYLRLATIFVLLRVIYLFHPILLACAMTLWRRHIRNRSLVNLWECPLTYFKKVLQVFCALKEPCRKSNLQGGALNAGVWASKSLASVSIGDASTSS